MSAAPGCTGVNRLRGDVSSFADHCFWANLFAFAWQWGCRLSRVSAEGLFQNSARLVENVRFGVASQRLKLART